MATNRFSIIVVLGALAALALFTVSMATSPHNLTASRSYDQIELVRAERYAAAAAQQAYLDQRHGEQTTAKYIDPQQAYLAYREGEWTAGVNPAVAYLNYRRGEWTGN